MGDLRNDLISQLIGIGRLGAVKAQQQADAAMWQGGRIEPAPPAPLCQCPTCKLTRERDGLRALLKLVLANHEAQTNLIKAFVAEWEVPKCEG